MSIFIIRAIRSEEIDPSKQIADKWPFEVNDLLSAKRIADQTALGINWDNADTFEITDVSGKVLSSRPFRNHGVAHADWTDKEC